MINGVLFLMFFFMIEGFTRAFFNKGIEKIRT